jgi:hypothetical protein
MAQVKHFFTTVILSFFSSAIAAPLVEPSLIDADSTRLLIAAVVGAVVQSLTLVTSGRGFDRLDRMKIKSRARTINLAEVFLTGVATAALIGLMRGVLNFHLPLSGEFGIAAVGASLGAEALFKALEKPTRKFLGGGDVEPK